MGPKVTSQPMKTLPSSGELWLSVHAQNDPVIKSGRQYHKSVSDDSASLTRRAVARKRRFSKKKKKKKKKDLRWARVQVAILDCKLAICSDCIQIPESGALVHHDSNWKRLWAAPEKPPAQLPRQVSPGSVFCIAPQFAFLPQIFRATGSAARNQRALQGSIVRAPPFPKQYARRRNRWKSWIMLPKLQEWGNWGHFLFYFILFFIFWISLLFLLRTYGDRHVSSG